MKPKTFKNAVMRRSFEYCNHYSTVATDPFWKIFFGLYDHTKYRSE